MASSPVEYFRAPDNRRPMAQLVCTECGAHEAFANRWEDEGQARARARHLGWCWQRKTNWCPGCIRKKRKEEPKVSKAKTSDISVPQPSREEKRAIMKLLHEVYDTEHERYSGGETDESVAECLEVRVGWVIQLREEFFGAAGANSDMTDLAKDIAALRADLTEAKDRAAADHDACAKALQGLAVIESQLGRIRSAVGPRVQKIAGLQ